MVRSGSAGVAWINMWAKTLACLAVFAAGGDVSAGVKVVWRDCEIDARDRWVPAAEDNLPAIMQQEFIRRYTCEVPEAARVAAGFEFVSRCLERKFERADVRACLKGRRMIFFGDSLAVQQSTSLADMLGWHPAWMEKGHPQNGKFIWHEDGTQAPALLECYRTEHNPVPGVVRCFDLNELQFPEAAVNDTRGGAYSVAEESEEESQEESEEESQARHPFLHMGQREGFKPEGRSAKGWVRGSRTEPYKNGKDGHLEVVVEEDSEDGPGYGAGGVGGHEGVTSVHLRSSAKGEGPDWVSRSLADFNETLASDVIIVNFGPHYHEESEESEESFRRDVSLLLDDLGAIADKATVIWRETSPTHFPALDGVYESFAGLPHHEKRNASCTGTPPEVHPRNAWVESYLEEKGLKGRIKILRIYRMSTFRGEAHHTCHMTSPDVLDSTTSPLVGEAPKRHYDADCRHWSEPSVVEEWNRLLLNHICPA